MSSSRLSPLDCAFLHVEDRANRMQLAGMLCFEGPAPRYDEFRDAVAQQLPLLPHFQDRLQHSRLWSRPRWVKDDAFDLDYHLHRVSLPAPGGHAEITDHIDHMTSAPLDLQRPLWEMSIVEGLEDGRWALSLKVHHAMVDGLSIMDIFAALCTPNPHERLPAHPVREARPKASVAVSTTVGSRPKLGRLSRASKLHGQAPRTRFNEGPSSPSRRTEYLTVPLQVVHDIRRPRGATVNHVVLSVVAGALHRYLARHDELVDELYAFVPVNRRQDDARGTLGNQIAMTYPALPTGEFDAERRISLVMDAVAATVASSQADDTAALMALGGIMPQPVAAAINRYLQFEANIFNLTVTNVPGPPVPVYFLGRQLQLILGATPLTMRHALTIAVLSYNGQLTFSLTIDPRRVPDGTDLVDDIRAELALLHGLSPLDSEPRKRSGSNRSVPTSAAPTTSNARSDT